VLRSSHIDIGATWSPNGTTVAGDSEQGNRLNQLNSPQGICVDNEDQVVYIADWCNHRIMKWKFDLTNGEIVAGGNGAGNRMDQLNNPLDVIIDKETDNLIICDSGNQRVVQWPCRNASRGQTIISNIDCRGLAMDDNRFLYVSNYNKSEVQRWRIGDSQGTVVAGGNGKGIHLNQLNGPQYVFVDQDHSVYISDMNNYRVMKWLQGAQEGIIVAGGQGKGNTLSQLSSPYGVIVDPLGTVYVADCGNHQILIVLKPTEQTPLSALYCAALIKESGDKLECGGERVDNKDYFIKTTIFSDVKDDMQITREESDLDKTIDAAEKGFQYDSPWLDVPVRTAHRAVFTHAGQVCFAASRICVHSTLHDAFVSKSVELAKKRIVGDPFDLTTEQGP
ncbi:unnamed protein product, partial [Rotaria sordida]